MRENNLIIICVTTIICISLIAGTFIMLKSNNNADSYDLSIIENIINPLQANANNSTTSDNSNKVDKINWATFYADGNPNTGEEVTVNVGPEHAGKTIQLSMNYYRDGYTLIEEAPKNYTVNSEGNVYIPDTAAMARYPDKCMLTVTCDGFTTTATCYLEKRKGSQTVYFD